MYSFTTTTDRYPHCCISCGGSQDREWFVDLGDDEYNSDQRIAVDVVAVYVCDQCLIAIGKEKGFVDQSPLLKKIEKLEAELFDANVKAHGLEQVFNGVFTVGIIAPDDPRVSDVHHLLQDAPEPQSGQQVEGEQSPPGAGEAVEPSDDNSVAGLRPTFGFDDGST